MDAPMTHEEHAERLAGQAVVVTGAASGIGSAICERLAKDGAQVLRVDKMAWTGSGRSLQVDISAQGASAAVISGAMCEFGRLDHLVNCAGIGRGKPAHETTSQEWLDFLATNLTACFELSKAALPYLSASKGSIVNIASVFGLVGFRGSCGYSASKAALIGMTRQMAADYGRSHVRVNAIAPGAISTPLTVSRLQPDQAHYRATVGMTPLGRAGLPHEIAGPVSFLCSEDASYITGAVLVVDGGWSSTRYAPD